VSKADSLTWEEQQIQCRITEAEGQITLLREQVQTAKEQLEMAHGEEMDLEVEAEALSRRELESAERYNELRTALALEQSALQSLERQKAPMATRLSELNGTIQRYQSEIHTWRERITSAHDENHRLTEEAESHRQTLSEIEEQGAATLDQRISTQERLQLLESQLQGLRQRSSETTELRSKSEVKLTKADMRLENLTTQLQERYQLDITKFTPDYRALLDAIEQQRKLLARSEKRRAAGEEPNEDDLDLPKRRKAKKAKEDAITQIEGAIVINTQEAPAVEGEEVTVVANADDATEEVVFTIEDDTDEEGNPINAETGEVTSEATAEVIEITDEEWAFVADVVSQLRLRLDSIGPVNLDAIQEFE
jgi:chromosome segregation protein